MTDRLGLLLTEALEGRGDASLEDLLRAVRGAGGQGVSRAAVARLLGEDPRFEPHEVLGRTRWRLSEAPTAPAAPPDTRDRVGALELRPWQAEALQAWSVTCRGVVEAVTGTGKTRLAVAAARAVLDAGGRVVVLVPTLELQDQWRRQARTLLPDVKVGHLGGGGQDDLFSHQLLLATPHSAAEVPLDLPPGAPGLLVADEAHRYGSPTWGRALPEQCHLRLALTATYERGDDGVEEVLSPYFGEVVYRYRYDRAVADGVVAPFRIALAAVELDAAERATYEQVDARVRTLHRELVGGLGMPREPGALLRAVAAVVADGERTGGQGPQVRACREYLARLRQRREVAATSPRKLDAVRSAAPALAARRSLVFTDTVDQATAATRVLRDAGVTAEAVHGELPPGRRRARLAAFRAGRTAVLVAPRVLDEGVDVPAADVALVLAAFRSRRHLVQRLGRVLRRKPDGAEARLVLVHARGTTEDPHQGGHAEFLAEVRGVARSIDHLDVLQPADSLATWLRT